ncbi:MAG: CBS domain-containing protein [Nitrospirae bacterium]|nr:CBS domain-containing protein [Nitrospirota bacterium]
MVKLKQIMTKNPVKIDSGKTIREAVTLMVEKKLGSVMVFHEKSGEIVGILGESDVVRNVLAKDLNPYIVKVEDVMSIPFVIDEEKNDDEASDLMSQKKVKHLAVSSHSRIVGIVSMQDLIRPVYAGKSFWT